LLTIIHRRAIDVLRRRRGHREAQLEQAAELPSQVSDPADEAAHSEQRASVARALLDLPEEQRQAIEMTYFGGLTIAEFAQRVSIPLGTAKSRLRLALERLRRAMIAVQTP
jgi:RNA polymerase sigma-70 factor (ECF subfamily)